MSERESDPGRDALLDRVYAGGPPEEPPAVLDEAIRAAARREVGSRPRSLRAALRAWRMPVSLAAVVVLSVSVVLLMKEEGADQLDAGAPQLRGMAEEARPPAPSAVPPAAPKKEEAASRRDSGSIAGAPSSDDNSRRGGLSNRQQPQADSAGPPGTAQAPVQQPARPPTGAERERAADPGALSQIGRLAKEAQSIPESKLERQTPPQPFQSEARSDASQAPQARAFSDLPAAKAAPQRDLPAKRAESDAGVRSTAPAVAASAPREPVWTGFERQPAEKWIARIEELRRAGQPTEAREMLEEFKRRFPEFPVPASLAP